MKQDLINQIVLKLGPVLTMAPHCIHCLVVAGIRCFACLRGTLGSIVGGFKLKKSMKIQGKIPSVCLLVLEAVISLAGDAAEVLGKEQGVSLTNN